MKFITSVTYSAPVITHKNDNVITYNPINNYISMSKKAQRFDELNELLEKWKQEDKLSNNSLTTINPACVNCRNHPINGGSGVCCCTLGGFNIY